MHTIYRSAALKPTIRYVVDPHLSSELGCGGRQLRTRSLDATLSLLPLPAMDDKKQLSPSGLESAQPALSVPQPHSARRWIACLIVPVCLFSLYHTSSHHPQPPHPHSPAAWKEWRAIQAYTAVAGACHRAKSTAQREATFLSIPSGESAREASHSFTADVHIAGLEGDRLSALRVKSQWEELLGLKVTDEATNIFEAGTVESRDALMGKSWKGKCKGRKGRMNRWWNGHKGVESPKPRVWIDTYFPMLNYPTTHSLTMTPAGDDSPSFVAKLLEDDVPEDSTSAEGRFQAPTFHGLSKNGTAKGQLVYAGRGTKAEFQALVAKGIDFTGKIAIVQYGGSFRGLKVASAAEVGAAGKYPGSTRRDPD
jgi:N-acetylated-alpha-linked acidic dipeptidase